MLNQQTLEKLHALRLHGMAEAFRAQSEQAGITELSFEERFALLVDQQWNWRQNRALERRLAKAKLRHRASVEDIDFRSPRGLDRALVRPFTQDSAWVREHQNLFLIGPTGIGKSFLACALAEKACRDGFTAFYTRSSQLFRDLALARADGSLRTLLARLARLDVLVVDDWAMAPLADAERRDFLEICEDRYQARSTVLTSQLPVAKWHEQIGDPTLADSILDRLVHQPLRPLARLRQAGLWVSVQSADFTANYPPTSEEEPQGTRVISESATIHRESVQRATKRQLTSPSGHLRT
jgi:DNA replication protein DnaC